MRELGHYLGRLPVPCFRNAVFAATYAIENAYSRALQGHGTGHKRSIGRHLQFSIDQVSSSLPLIRDGRVRALAVSSAKRLESLPDVPTFLEQRYRNLEAYTFVAMLASTGTSDAIVRRPAAAPGHAAHDPDVARQIKTLGAAAEAMAPEDFRAYLEKEDAVWLPVVHKVSRLH
jgi:tripartite-type tricarboxylate transporter receptor subunit TctC